MAINKNDPDRKSNSTTPRTPVTWGPWLFRITLFGTLAFMWWLAIYDHGVKVQH